MNVTYEKDRWLKRLRAKRHESMLPYDLGDLLVGALERELSEPLDSIDMPEAEKARLRETY